MCLTRPTSYVVLLIVNALLVVTQKENPLPESFTELYQRGVDAYLENRYADCVEYLEDAIEKYKHETKSVQNCRLKCAEEAANADPLYPIDVENLLFFEYSIRNTLCVVKCRKGNNNTMELKSQKLFEERKPYGYLHICYYQTKEFQKAASAAFTYLVTHPKDANMMKTLQHYSKIEEVDMKEIVNYEAKDYVYLYTHGVDAYGKKQWKEVEMNMEESLISYLQAEEECRAQCEGPLIQEFFLDFYPSIANHFTYCLKCKKRCREKLNNLNGEYYEDLLPSHYHYLQFIYFKAGDLKAACEAVASYLLFYPKDETMRSNAEYYKALPKYQDGYIVPRQEAVKYLQRQTYENRLLNFIEEQYNFDKLVSVVELEKLPEEHPSVDQQSSSL